MPTKAKTPFYQDFHETEPKEKLSNLTNRDMIARAVQLAYNISNYDLYRRTVAQEFGLNDLDLDDVIGEAMKVVAESVGSPTPVGNENSPSNNPGERPIDVKRDERTATKIGKATDQVNKIAKELIIGANVNFGGFQPKPKAPRPSFMKFWRGFTGNFISYKDSHNAKESTQTDFKKMWKGENGFTNFNKAKEEIKGNCEHCGEDYKMRFDVNATGGKGVKCPHCGKETNNWDTTNGSTMAPSLVRIKSRVRKTAEPGQYLMLAHGQKFSTTSGDKNLEAGRYYVRGTHTNAVTIQRNGTSYTIPVYDLDRFTELSKSVMKSLSNTQKQMLTDAIVEKFYDVEDDLKWQVKAKSWLTSKGVADNDIAAIMKEVSEELLDNNN